MAAHFFILHWLAVLLSLNVVAAETLNGPKMDSAGEKEATVRLVTFNVLGARGFPWKGSSAVAWPETSQALLRELAMRFQRWKADVVILQEAPTEADVRELARMAGMNYAFFPTRAVPSADWPFGFPGAVLSRYILEESRPWAGEGKDVPAELFQRHWGEVTVRIGDRRLRVAGLHLCSDWGGVNRESTRLSELSLALADSSADILAGDFNSIPESKPWQTLHHAGWRDGWIESRASGEGWTVNPRQRFARIDYVWLASRTRWVCLDASVPEDLSVDVAGRSLALSDHYPILVELRWSEAASSARPVN